MVLCLTNKNVSFSNPSTLSNTAGYNCIVQLSVISEENTNDILKKQIVDLEAEIDLLKKRVAERDSIIAKFEDENREFSYN